MSSHPWKKHSGLCQRVCQPQSYAYRVCVSQFAVQHTHTLITYLPHKAVAEVSKDKEPIGRERAEFNWFESQLMSDSNEVRFK